MKTEKKSIAIFEFPVYAKKFNRDPESNFATSVYEINSSHGDVRHIEKMIDEPPDEIIMSAWGIKAAEYFFALETALNEIKQDEVVKSLFSAEKHETWMSDRPQAQPAPEPVKWKSGILTEGIFKSDLPEPKNRAGSKWITNEHGVPELSYIVQKPGLEKGPEDKARCLAEYYESCCPSEKVDLSDIDPDALEVDGLEERKIIDNLPRPLRKLLDARKMRQAEQDRIEDSVERTLHPADLI